MKNFLIVLRTVVVVILFQTLYFKFTGAPESKFIFTTLGIEPWGRWFAGVSELVAGILLIVSATQLLGALIAMGVISGAILSHIFILGFVVQDDGGLLFGLACVVFICSALIVFLQREKIPHLIQTGLNTFLKAKK